METMAKRTLRAWLAAAAMAASAPVWAQSAPPLPAAPPQPPAAPAAAPTPTPAPASAPAPATSATAAAAPAAPAPAQKSSLQLPVIRATLKNGLRVVLSPDATVPTVAIVVYYDVGSRNEERGRSGFAHLFEHMMFQGSDNVQKGEHFRLVMNRGGSPNGTTSDDRTNFFQTLPASELELGLWLEADRMRSLAITQENFENQRQTVMEERRQSYDNRPYMGSMLRINELAYGDYFPYAHSTIGDMEDLKKAPLAAVREFFEHYYAPNNAVVSVAGDFDPQQALRLIERHFGGIHAHERPAYAPGELAPQKAERTESMVDPLAELPAFHISYPIPPDGTPDHYALEMLAMVLSDGESSRLYQKLIKEKQLLQEISVGTDDRRGPDQLAVWGICSEGKQASEARDVIYHELSDIADKGVTERELQKAKNGVRSSFVFGLAANMSRAMRLGEFELYFGDANLLNQEADRYLAVTLADVQRVAKQYFAAQSRTVLDVNPKTSATATNASTIGSKP
jgi:predicted Zn-dependent peptidase